MTEKVKTLCRQDVNLPLEVLLHQLNAALRGWCTYFRPGVSGAAFGYLRGFVWQRVFRWLRRKHRRSTWKDLRRKYCDGGWWRRGGEMAPVQPGRGTHTTRYRYRCRAIPSPWPQAEPSRGDGTCGEPDAVPSRMSGSGGGPEKRAGRKAGTALRADLTRSNAPSE
jgi:RNA-directed DNA polymerase